MTKLLSALALLVALSGCAQLSSKEAVVGCQAADTVTTIVALSAGGVEVNPVAGWIIGNFGYVGWVIAKVVVAFILMNEAESHPETVGAVTAVTCAAAAYNLLL